MSSLEREGGCALIHKDSASFSQQAMCFPGSHLEAVFPRATAGLKLHLSSCQEAASLSEKGQYCFRQVPEFCELPVDFAHLPAPGIVGGVVRTHQARNAVPKV